MPARVVDTINLYDIRYITAHTTWEQVKGIDSWDPLWACGNDDGMPSIVTARATCTDIDLSREDIDKFTLAFIAPLCTENDGYCFDHEWCTEYWELMKRKRTRHACYTFQTLGRVVVEFESELARYVTARPEKAIYLSELGLRRPGCRPSSPTRSIRHRRREDSRDTQHYLGCHSYSLWSAHRLVSSPLPKRAMTCTTRKSNRQAHNNPSYLLLTSYRCLGRKPLDLTSQRKSSTFEKSTLCVCPPSSEDCLKCGIEIERNNRT